VSPSLKPAVSRAEDVAVSAELDERERRELRRKARAATLESLRVLGGDAQRPQRQQPSTHPWSIISCRGR
jgi:hypothetical protein